MRKLFFDIETYSSVDLSVSGVYKYVESPDFEILLLCYAYDDEPVKCVDVELEGIPEDFSRGFYDKNTVKLAFNAAFERTAFKRIGMEVPIEEWECIMVKSAYCGYPLSLEQVSSVMKLGEKGKLSIGKQLIKLFCNPGKDGKRLQPSKRPEDWELFKIYCINDVVSEREIYNNLACYTIPDWERTNYIVDQQMNDRGVLMDMPFVRNAIEFSERASSEAYDRLKNITGLENPNSPKQLKDWLSRQLGKEITELTKDSIAKLLPEVDGAVREALQLRLLLAKSSIKKYVAMEACHCRDSRARGMFQIYGANRTGRWTSKLIQLQSLPQNHMKDLELARETVARNDYDLATILWPSIPNVLSELIRTAFVAPKGYTFAVADFSAIEARVISWVAQEEWRLEVFRTHGKIYEATAATMFGVPISSVTKGSELRQRGKTSELALGYAGGVDALTRMDREGRIPDSEKPELVMRWRKANPNIVQLWTDIENCAKYTIKTHNHAQLRSLGFDYDNGALTIELPSGRKLFYNKPFITTNRWGKPTIGFYGINQDTKQWYPQETYGGKLCENIIQAIARDALAYALQTLDREGYKVVLQVHDEAIAEVPSDKAEEYLTRMEQLMGQEIPWMKGLPLRADGYITNFYKKD